MKNVLCLIEKHRQFNGKDKKEKKPQNIMVARNNLG